MSFTPKHLLEGKERLERMGCTNAQIDLTRRHPRITFSYEGRTESIVCSGTPRDPSNSPDHIAQNARRVLGIKGTPGQHRKRKAKARIQEAEPTLTGRGIVTRNPFEALRSHACYGALLDRKAADAFRRLWMDTCTGMFGTASVVASLGRKHDPR